MDLIAELGNAFADVVDLLFRGVEAHGNNHGYSIHIQITRTQVKAI
jgi:hypothetical protein